MCFLSIQKADQICNHFNVGTKNTKSFKKRSGHPFNETISVTAKNVNAFDPDIKFLTEEQTFLT